jgi:hypothetical protein
LWQLPIQLRHNQASCAPSLELCRLDLFNPKSVPPSQVIAPVNQTTGLKYNLFAPDNRKQDPSNRKQDLSSPRQGHRNQWSGPFNPKRDRCSLRLAQFNLNRRRNPRLVRFSQNNLGPNSRTTDQSSPNPNPKYVLNLNRDQHLNHNTDPHLNQNRDRPPHRSRDRLLHPNQGRLPNQSLSPVTRVTHRNSSNAKYT